VRISGVLKQRINHPRLFVADDDAAKLLELDDAADDDAADRLELDDAADDDAADRLELDDAADDDAADRLENRHVPGQGRVCFHHVFTGFFDPASRARDATGDESRLRALPSGPACT
jgi:hypothetical protein